MKKKRKWHKWGTLPPYLFSLIEWDKVINRLSKICNGEKVKFPIISPYSFSKFEKRVPKKRNYSYKKNVGNINCNSPVWKNKSRCN